MSSQSKKTPPDSITGSEALVRALEDLGVEVIFGYPGGANLPIYDKLRKSKIRHIMARHEQGAAHMADGYARVAKKPGVCLATSGPGATNLVTGLANALLDSTPLVAITGQISRQLIGTDAFQEVDCINITMPVTKHNELIRYEKDLIPAIESAFYIANSGRKGPVLIDLPVDVLNASYPHEFQHKINLPGYKPTLKGNIGQIKRALKALKNAEKPLILFGGGVVLSDSVSELLHFIRATQIPVIRTLMGTGVIPHNDPLFVGMIGTHGSSRANKILAKEADVVLMMGTRLGDRSFVKKKSEFAENAKIIHLDIDPAEIGKNIKVDIPIVGDIKEVLSDMNERISKKPFSKEKPWVTVKKKKTKLSTRDDAEILEDIFISLSGFDMKLNVSTDVGRHQMWANHFCTNPLHLPLLTSGGLGTMGFGLPAAIGAWFAEPETPVVNISGDGSFMMNMQEFAIAVEHQIPLTVIIANDSRLSMIRELQHSNYKDRYTVHELGRSVSFKKIAEAMGGDGLEITHNNQITSAIQQALSSGKPTIIDFNLENISKSSHLTWDTKAS
ncbi:MAG: biosynthetic-type acetolactate synthase large subunit [Deltaproteobacteria bacterium]|nr:biosynthetic-type acetolactate synthase large subunit [Deltaproteobacteria bacterium]